MKPFFSLSAVLLGLAPQAIIADVNPAMIDAAIKCNQDYGPLTFVLLEDEAVMPRLKTTFAAIWQRLVSRW